MTNTKRTKSQAHGEMGDDQRNDSGLSHKLASAENFSMGLKEKRGRKPKGLSPFTKNFANLLRENRCSHRRAAKIAGVAPSVISGWTAGSMPNNPVALLKITEELQADFQFILTGVSTNPISKNRISEIFDMDEHPELTGLFVLEAKRLRIKKAGAK